MPVRSVIGRNSSLVYLREKPASFLSPVPPCDCESVHIRDHVLAVYFICQA
jgi:hypothetical protein